jgi:hypothetical protein
MTRCEKCHAVREGSSRVCAHCGGASFVTRWEGKGNNILARLFRRLVYVAEGFSPIVSMAGILVTIAIWMVLIVGVPLGLIWLIVRFIHWAWETPIPSP